MAQASPDQPLVSLLRSQGLSLLMQQFILYAVAMADSDQESLVPSHSAPAKQQLPAVDQHQPGSASASTSSSPSSSASPAAAVSQPVSGLATQPGTPSDTPSASASEHQSSAEATCADASPSSSAGVVSIEQGVKALRQYLSSVGRYGPSSGAFLTPMYGCAELPQAFCRCAISHSLPCLCLVLSFRYHKATFTSRCNYTMSLAGWLPSMGLCMCCGSQSPACCWTLKRSNVGEFRPMQDRCCCMP